MLKSCILLLCLIPFLVFSQENDDYTNRLKAIYNGNTTYYNIDGINFKSQTLTNRFTKKDLKSIFRRYSIGNDEPKTIDSLLPYNNLTITKSKKITDSLNENVSYYFVEDKQKMVTAFCFSFFNKQDTAFERKFIKLIIEDQIPKSVFAANRIDSIDFAGRKIQLESNCYWTNVNTVQCPYYGEMNWSVHKSLTTAKEAIQDQLLITKSKKGIKVISEIEVKVVFEKTPTKALKIVYGFTGLTKLAASTTGGKTLIVYYVNCKVRDNYVSCVMSFWNNDKILASGLPPLLDKVMKLEK